eukprot:g45577.t1
MDDASIRLECPFCLEYFRQAVMLQCSHNLCRECAMKVLGFEALVSDTFPPVGQNNRGPRLQPGAVQPDGLDHKTEHKSSQVLGVRCPQCRQVTPEAKLLPNRALEASIEKARLEALRSAISQHLPNHPELLNGVHTLVDASKLKEVKSVASAAECTAHKQKLQLWCRSHEMLVCLVCALTVRRSRRWQRIRASCFNSSSRRTLQFAQRLQASRKSSRRPWKKSKREHEEH